MSRQMDPHRWFAWHPVVLSDTGDWAWMRTVWRRKAFLGPRTEALGDPDFLIWYYYDNEPQEGQDAARTGKI